MTTVQLKRLAEARPFHPFTIHLTDGRAISVSHPEVLSVSPGGRTFGVWTDDDAIEIIDLLLVVSFSEVRTPFSSSDNAA